MYIKPLNDSARKVVITDPTGMIKMYYVGEFYIIPDEVIRFELGMPAGFDPELALVACNYDSSTYALADCLADGTYIVTTGGDSIATTGYCDSSIILYPSLTNTASGQQLTYFKDTENLDRLLYELTRDQNGNAQASWAYADEVEQAAAPATIATEATYIVKYVDQDGNPVSGVMCQVCDDTLCQVFISDANGICEFTLAPYYWEIHTLMVPAGYTADTQTIVTAPVVGGELVFTLTKN